MKKKVKRIIYSLNKIDLSKYIETIKKYDAISFDIFDTLLKRNVESPSDVFLLMNTGMSDFRKKRIEAEKKARSISNSAEITINDIYFCFDNISQEQRKKYIQKELEMEYNILVPNLDILPLYKWCVEQKKKIYLTSDMYLPEEFIKRILSKNQITGYNKLYISSTYKSVKSNGSLYYDLLKEEKICASELLHIGDSYKADYIEAKKVGIKAIIIPKYVKRRKYNYTFDSKIKTNIFNSFINNTVRNIEDEYYQFGYECFGPMLWGYIRWIYQSLNNEEIKKVYFFSRDGYIMKKAFDFCFSDSDISSYYLEVSRRSLRVPTLWLQNSFENVLNMISVSKLISLESIFDSVGLNINDYIELISKYGFSVESEFDRNTLQNNTDLINMYNELNEAIDIISKKEFNVLKKYLNQSKVFGKFAIVDIGWSGGMQRFLTQALSQIGVKNDIYGYYLGVTSHYKRNIEICPNMKLFGYLFDYKNDKTAIDKRSCFVGLFETLFLEQGGSVKNYAIDVKGKVNAVRYPYEYLDGGIQSKEYILVKTIQKGALDFIENASKDNILMQQDFSADELFDCLRECGANPRKKDINMFADFRFFDDGNINKLAVPQKIGAYVFNLNKLKQDFLMSRWKTGFLKNLLKVKLPYEKIYNYLLKYK